MSGYLGDLSQKQQQALDEFKLCIQDIWKKEFTDSFLLRWLRARDFDVKKAEHMLRKNQVWRHENNIDLLLETYQLPEVLRRYLPGGISGHDRGGRPIWILRFGNCDYKGLLQCVSKEELSKACFYQVEQIYADFKIQSEKLGKNIDTVTVVCDYDNFSLKQVYSLQAMEFFREITVQFDTNYPETLERYLCINAPSFFPFFWKLVRPFVSEKTASKIEVFPQEAWKSALLKYIDPSQLPVHWGGELLGPDGDPECSHKIRPGGEVPVELYLKNGPKVWDDPQSVNCTLERGEHLEVPVQVERAGCILRWKFQTGPGHDVDFSVTRGLTENGKQQKKVLPVTRVRCDLVPETGELENPDIGTYSFRFDNSFSWFSNKRISYVLQVIYPEEILTPVS
ncbi:SEC14-like protein 2 [Ixodes scapularis]|uniref:SEC14-like protein 2 n=1 Tax=Ixodes scapularis TaxID=6945 RepID=UPI001C3862D8|nr:SEC14-like protein 2 [Ixodes scapularis]